MPTANPPIPVSPAYFNTPTYSLYIHPTTLYSPFFPFPLPFPNLTRRLYANLQNSNSRLIIGSLLHVRNCLCSLEKVLDTRWFIQFCKNPLSSLTSHLYFINLLNNSTKTKAFVRISAYFFKSPTIESLGCSPCVYSFYTIYRGPLPGLCTMLLSQFIYKPPYPYPSCPKRSCQIPLPKNLRPIYQIPEKPYPAPTLA